VPLATSAIAILLAGHAVAGELRIESWRSDDIDIWNDTKLEGVVDVVERLGEASYVYMHLEDGSALTVRADGHSRARSGDRITVSAEIDAAHLFDAEGQAFRPLGTNPKYSAELPAAA
jgi:ABC-type sugar transport system ATPase subunit